MPFRFGAIFSSSFRVKNSAYDTAGKAPNDSVAAQRREQPERKQTTPKIQQPSEKKADVKVKTYAWSTRARKHGMLMSAREAMTGITRERDQHTVSCKSSTIFSRFSSNDRPFRFDMTQQAASREGVA